MYIHIYTYVHICIYKYNEIMHFQENDGTEFIMLNETARVKKTSIMCSPHSHMWNLDFFKTHKIRRGSIWKEKRSRNGEIS
jgi:hypothetical protein